MIVLPVSCQMRFKSSWSWSRVSASRAANGSSMSSNSESCASARASAQRWRMPPESWCGRWSAKSMSPTMERSRLTVLFRSSKSTLWRRIGNSTLRRTVSQGRSAGSWNMTAGRPSAISIVPEVILSRPATSDRSVDLPHPEAPRMHTNSPLPTSSETFSSAITECLALPNTFVTPSRVTKLSSGSRVSTAGRGANATFISRALRS